MHQIVVSCCGQQYMQTRAISANTARAVDQGGKIKRIWIAFAFKSGRVLKPNSICSDHFYRFCFAHINWYSKHRGGTTLTRPSMRPPAHFNYDSSR
jgi:hypothetical protein